jgi:hypothetical protein
MKRSNLLSILASSVVLLEMMPVAPVHADIGAGVPLETRKLLLGHANGDITTHYSAAELKELLDATEKIVDRKVAQTPTLISRKSENVEKCRK